MSDNISAASAGLSTFVARFETGGLRSARNLRADFSDGNQMIDPQFRRRLANFEVTMLRLRTELAHLPQDRDALSIRIQLHQRVERGFHRFGIGVVAVVEKLHAVNLAQLQPRFRQRR